MIDLERETLIPLRDVPKRLPPRTNDRRLHISAVYRWATRGVRGVVLETIRIGGTTFTSVQALQRFAEAQSRDSSSTPAGPSTQARQRAIASASERVRRELGLSEQPGADER